MQPGNTGDLALPRPSYEGLHGTVLCIECGFHGLGIDHPEWCSWEVLKTRPATRWNALALVELGERVAALLDAPQKGARHSQTHP